MTDLGSSLIICLGANLPTDIARPAETLRIAISRISRIGIAVTAVSRFYATPCFPAGAGPDYVNAAIAGRTRLTPQEVLVRLHEIESAHGRNRKTRWGQRTLDLDLAVYDDLVRPDLEGWRRWAELAPQDQQLAAPDRLILPHPRMQDRAFVLVPMCDIAPDWRHPVFGTTVARMTADLPAGDRAAVIPL